MKLKKYIIGLVPILLLTLPMSDCGTSRDYRDKKPYVQEAMSPVGVNTARMGGGH